MKGEFNDLTYNYTNITFSNATNNTETSDELTATLLYQDKMGTEYSKKKKVGKFIGITGITILTTAAAMKVGGLLANGFIINPPKISNNTYEVSNGGFHYSFVITNERKYKVHYFIDVNDVMVIDQDCTETKTYEGTFKDFQEGDKCKFYVTFSNNFDYRRTIEIVNFNKGGII